MVIFPLPPTSRIAYLDVQYFNNGKRRGYPEHQLKVQYVVQVEDDKQKRAKFCIPISCEPKVFNRKARNKMSPEMAAEVAAVSKALKAQGIAHFFGLREICFAKAGKIMKTQDPDSYCWVQAKEDHLEVTLRWAGEFITVQVKQYKETLSEKQSVGIGYWDRNKFEKDKLADIMADLGEEHGKGTASE